ncbi:hypothetical protein EXIGLDRAFT_760650 [Exidia glandulosa HHB12029]|uniref:Uncharacterized protein n=1 Tax=Exidia glandulosa HHB12029 TaxID=1314781 RepID=A0A165P7D7_EXIGL|nr:hypothetical protein EXIGLDRAFT_760650 [Exidia glandulosa HHB12029]
MSLVVSKKRKLEDGTPTPAVSRAKKSSITSLLRESIALATASDMDDASLDPLLDNLSSAYHMACTPSTEWDWAIDAKSVLTMDAGDKLVLAEFVNSREKLERTAR